MQHVFIGELKYFLTQDLLRGHGLFQVSVASPAHLVLGRHLELVLLLLIQLSNGELGEYQRAMGVDPLPALGGFLGVRLALQPQVQAVADYGGTTIIHRLRPGQCDGGFGAVCHLQTSRGAGGLCRKKKRKTNKYQIFSIEFPI